MVERHPEYMGSAEWLNEATLTGQRISRMYSDVEGKKKIDVVLNENEPGNDYAVMLRGSERGGKTGIQKWFEAEVQAIAERSDPKQLSTYYHRLAVKMRNLEDYLNRI